MAVSKFLHTMLRVKDLEKSIDFYTKVLNMQVTKRTDYESGKFTLVFLSITGDTSGAEIELTYNWDNRDYEIGTAYGHIALATNDIYKTCENIKAAGGIITREPGAMKFGGSTVIAFVKDPDGYLIELIETK
ncbi:lactoylglutathione lyase [Rickettsiales bacterium LUAb2]